MSGMNGSMNGKPCWSVGARTKVYDFGLNAEPDDEREAILAEAAQLVRAGIKAGLVKPAQAPKPAKPPKTEKYGAGWRHINCAQCGIQFYRGHIGISKCSVCRLPPVVCDCGKTFQPLHNKAKTCSMKCAMERQLATFHARREAKKKAEILVECIICHAMKPRRQAGGTFAKTCSKECASVYRKQKGAEYKQSRTIK